MNDHMHPVELGVMGVTVAAITHHIPEIGGLIGILWYGANLWTWVVNRGWKRREDSR